MINILKYESIKDVYLLLIEEMSFITLYLVISFTFFHDRSIDDKLMKHVKIKAI